MEDAFDRCEYLFVHEDVVKRVKSEMPPDSALYMLSELFKVFGDPTRVKILYVLLESELCVCDIAQLLGLTQTAVSQTTDNCSLLMKLHQKWLVLWTEEQR